MGEAEVTRDTGTPGEAREQPRVPTRVRFGRHGHAAVGLFRRVQFILGTLLVGGGLCTAYFCWAAFAEARAAVRVEVPVPSAGATIKKVDVDPQLQKILGSVGGVDASELRNLGEPQLRMYHRSVEKQIEGYQLLSATLALVLGGLCLCLSSPPGTAHRHPAEPGAAPDTGRR